MKLLMIYCDNFKYKTTLRTLDFVEDLNEEKEFEKVEVGFIQIEEKDEEKETEIIRKLIKNLKWISKKNKTNKIILHSFAHLSESKASPEVTLDILNKSEERLKNSGYEVYQTPFGYFLDLSVIAPGFSLARVFKSF